MFGTPAITQLRSNWLSILDIIHFAYCILLVTLKRDVKPALLMSAIKEIHRFQADFRARRTYLEDVFCVSHGSNCACINMKILSPKDDSTIDAHMITTSLISLHLPQTAVSSNIELQAPRSYHFLSMVMCT